MQVVSWVLFWGLLLLLGLPALALTLARPWDTTIEVLVRLQAFVPLAILLYAGVLAVCLAGSLRRTRERRAGRLVVALLALAGLGVHSWWHAPQLVGDNPEPAARARALTVMTSNLYRGQGDAAELVAAAAREQVDILVVQEVTPSALARMDQAGLGELLPHRIGSPHPDVAGTMLFSNERLGEAEQLPTDFQGWRVEVGTLTVLAVHAAAPLWPEQWREDHRVILDAAESSLADLVVGDLNASADHAVLRDLDAAGFRDAAELANEGWQPTWPANHVGMMPWLPVPLVRIDHVLVGPEMAALGTQTVDIEGTDHLALVAEVARR